MEEGFMAHGNLCSHKKLESLIDSTCDFLFYITFTSFLYTGCKGMGEDLAEKS